MFPGKSISTESVFLIFSLHVLLSFWIMLPFKKAMHLFYSLETIIYRTWYFLMQITKVKIFVLSPDTNIKNPYTFVFSCSLCFLYTLSACHVCLEVYHDHVFFCILSFFSMPNAVIIFNRVLCFQHVFHLIFEDLWGHMGLCKEPDCDPENWS